MVRLFILLVISATAFIESKASGGKENEPIQLILEVRKNKQPIYVKDAPNFKGNNLFLLPVGSLLKFTLSPQELLERESNEKRNLGVWRKVTLKVDDGKYIDGYVFDRWNNFHSHIVRGDGLPIKHNKDWNRFRINLFRRPLIKDITNCDVEDILCYESTNPSLEFFVHDTQWVKVRENIKGQEFFNFKLFYRVNFYFLNENNSLEQAQAWVLSDDFVRSFSYSSIAVSRCISIYDLSEASQGTKNLFLDLGVLKKEKTYLEKLDKKLFAFSENSQQDANRFRRWLQTRLIERGSTDADPLLIREELKVGSEWGLKVGFHRMTLEQENLTENKARAFYESDNVHIGAHLFIPIFLDMEMIIGGEVSIPYQTPEELTLVSAIYPVRIGQWFNYQIPPYLGDSIDIHAGFGFSYQTLFSSGPLPFAYETVVGVQLLLNLKFGRLYTSFKFEPLGNNFNIRLTNHDKVVSVGYNLTKNLESRDWAIFARYGILDFNSEGETELQIENIQLGISKDF